jgi:hypothetical protein
VLGKKKSLLPLSRMRSSGWLRSRETGSRSDAPDITFARIRFSRSSQCDGRRESFPTA